MMVQFSHYDTIDYIKTEDNIAAYFDAAIENGDAILIAAVIDDTARMRYRKIIQTQTI